MARKVRNLVDLFDDAAPGANVEIPGATVVVSGSRPANIRHSYRVQFANATVLKAIVSRSGAADQTILFNEGTALAAGAGYEFEVPVLPGESWEHQIGTDGAIAFFTIDEVTEGGDA